MVWKNGTFSTTSELVTFANENEINLKADETTIIQDTLGKWHLFYEE